VVSAGIEPEKTEKRVNLCLYQGANYVYGSGSGHVASTKHGKSIVTPDTR